MSYLLFASGFAEPMVLVGFALAIAVTALSFMAGEFFSMPSLKAFSKMELRELGVTAIIIVLLVGLSAPGSVYDRVGAGMAPQPAAGQTPNACPEWLAVHGPYIAPDALSPNGRYENGNYAFASANYFLGCRQDFGSILASLSAPPASLVNANPPIGTRDGVLLPELIGFYEVYMAYEIFAGIGSTFAVGFTLPPLLTAYKLHISINNVVFQAFLVPIVDAHTLLVDFIGMLVSATAAQNMLLTFIEINVPLVILPLGMVMRAFPFTRKAGSTIIAFCVAAYFIYPLTILVNERIYDDVSHTKCPLDNPEQKKEDRNVCSKNSDCCSDNCISNKCRPRLGDFKKFASTFNLCNREIGDQTVAADENASFVSDLRNGQNAQAGLDNSPSNSSSTKANARLKDRNAKAGLADQNEADMRQKEVSKVFTTPGAGTFLLAIFEWYVNEVGRLLVLHSLFIVIEILITLTLIKDIALLIGGEPRLLGISKLV